MNHPTNPPVDWETLVTQEENRLYRTALAILGNPSEAQDAVQEAFLAFLEKAPADLESPGAWLMRVLVNGCKSPSAPALAAAHRTPVGGAARPLPPGAGGAGGIIRSAAPGPGRHPSALLRGLLHSGDRPAAPLPPRHGPLPALPGPRAATPIVRRRFSVKYYNQYMDSQQVSPDFHRTLCELQPRPRRSHVRKAVALAACGAAAGITWLARGGLRQIEDTVVNGLANVSGIVCDGAKASCAAKIDAALEGALLGHQLAMAGRHFSPGDGIVQPSADQTVSTVGRLGREGMRQTDLEILNIMLGR